MGDHSTGKSKGFGFICYEDQRSTILAVDNFNGMKLLGRLVRVDNVHTYKLPKDLEKMDADSRQLFLEGCAPKPIEEENADKSSEDSPSREEHKSRKKKRIDEKEKKKKSKKHKKSRRRSRSLSSDCSSDSKSEATSDHARQINQTIADRKKSKHLKEESRDN